MVQVKKVNIIMAGLVLAALLSLSYVSALTSSLNFKFSPAQILGVSAGMLVAYTLIFWNKWSRRILLGLAVIAGVTLFFYINKKELFPQYASRVVDCLYWLNDYILGNAEINPRYELYITIGICFLITFPVFFLTVKRFNFLLILITGMGIFVGQWVLEFFVSESAFYVFIFTLLLCYFRHVYYRKHTGESGDYVSPASFILWVAPISVLITLVAFSIPASDKPIEWKWMDEKIMTLSNYFRTGYSNSFSKFDYFSVEYTGFGREGKLGGKVRLDTTEVLNVKGERPAYLRASGKDTYTGSAWQDTNKTQMSIHDMNNQIMYANTELSIGLPLLAGGNEKLDNLFHLGTYTVKYLGVKTKSVFLPGVVQQVTFNGNPQLGAAVNGNSTLVMDKTMGRDFTYTVETAALDYSNEDFRSMMRKSRKGLYEDILKGKLNSELFRRNARINPGVYGGKNGPVVRYSDFVSQLAQNSKDIYAKYTQIPDTVPQRVKDLALEITSAKQNNYDKVKAIEQYLSQNFPYTLEPKATPKGKDFVDYFLFDLKQGYCTYYASSMVILARSIGMPARYVEGYMMPSATSEENTYIVTNEKAHAWVEVYFEGFGWLPFEPTAAFTTSFYASNAPLNLSSESITDPSFEGEEEESGLIKELEMDDSGSSSGEVVNSYPDFRAIGAWAALGLVAAFFLMLLINAVRSRSRIRKMMRMETRDSILAFYAHFMQVFKLHGYTIKAGETPSQYSDRIDRYFILRPVNFKMITESFIVARYSRNELSENTKNSYLVFYRELVENSLSDFGKLRFFYYKFVLGVL